MELNYKLCEATLHEGLTKRRSSDRTELNAIINIINRFGTAEFYIGSIQKISYWQNHIAFYSEYILVTMFHRSVELK